MHIASMQLADLLDHYLALLEQERQDVSRLEEALRSGDAFEMFFIWQEIISKEVDLQVAFQRVSEVLSGIKLNPSIDKKCRETLLVSGTNPEESLREANNLLQRRAGLIGALREYLVAYERGLIEERGEQKIIQAFVQRWEETLAKLQDRSD